MTMKVSQTIVLWSIKKSKYSPYHLVQSERKSLVPHLAKTFYVKIEKNSVGGDSKKSSIAVYSEGVNV